MRDSGASAALIRAALKGDGAAVRQLVDALSPVVHARVARALLRSGTRARAGRDLRQDVEDFTQEVFASLFEQGGRALLAWDPERGMSLVNFVGLVTEHQVASILRSGRRNPWTEEPTVEADLERAAGFAEEVDGRVYSRQVLAQLLERLSAELTPRGLALFHLLFVEERSVEATCAETGLSTDAVYAWRSRLGKVAARLVAEIRKGPPSDPSLALRTPGEEPRPL
jgi:DNA-directed RNA polymerase specialized sigma24 family protein